MLYVYGYDQLNRIKRANAFTGLDSASNVWTPVATTNYQENFTYDGNGNILTAYRNGNAGNMDNLTYQYSHDTNGRLANNKLNYVTDAASDGAYSTDIKNQPTNNYSYDAIGNLMSDAQAGISNIDWSVYGKIKTITKSSGNIAYTYDPAGQRVTKTVGTTTTYYVRDAQGNTLALYDNAGSHSNWREQDLYGSSRLGMWMPNVNLATNNATTVYDTIGRKFFELTNHLGNVLATITDRRLQVRLTDTTVAYYQPDVASAQSYYAFGMEMPGMTYNPANYSYGFNGKENDNEVKGVGNQINYGVRISDPRLGRFLSTDPLGKEYPWYTPYQFAGNMPIRFIDVDGMEQGQPKWYFEPMPLTGTAGDYAKILPNAATGIVNGAISLLYMGGDLAQKTTDAIATGEWPTSRKEIQKNFIELKNHAVERFHDLQNTKFSDFANYAMSPQGLTEESQVVFTVYTMSSPVLETPTNLYLEQNIKILPGPELPEKIALTFEDGVYSNRQVGAEGEVFYKYHGVNNRTGRKYSWVTNKLYNSEASLRKDLAIRKDWGITIKSVTKFKAPGGTWVSEGKAASQGAGYEGGGYQGVITNLPKASIQETKPAF